ncbi:MAG: M20 family metallopeptidase [Thermoguttaceae bacterium]
MARLAQTLDPVQTLAELVAVPSVNPMGGSIQDAFTGESRLTAYLDALFERLGLTSERQTVEPGRENILARLEGVAPDKGEAPILLLAAHQDTVPAGDMTAPPWTPTIDQNRLYGRGACDVKGGMATILAAASRLLQGRPPAMPTIVLAFTVNEEYGFTGASALASSWQQGRLGLLPRRPDAAIVAEPTSLQVVVAHKGVVRWRCHARGRAAHSAQPEAGQNAIYRMARVVRAIERYQDEVVGTLGFDPWCGAATVSVGTISGGLSVNTVPDRCTIEIDRRLAGGERPEEARQHLIDYLDRQCDARGWLEHEPPFMQGLPLSSDANGRLADRLAAVVREVCGQCRQIGVPYATDAACFAAVGVPTVVFGPGSIQQAHTADEWIDLDELTKAVEILCRFAASAIDLEERETPECPDTGMLL